MPLTIATWNINSVRLRLDLVLRFLAEYRPDVLCLQETKCADANFPVNAFRDAGYGHVEMHGQKAYHGVATISRLPLERPERRSYCDRPDARHLSTGVRHDGAQVVIHNYYVPSGGDEPDVDKNWKFAHKLQFLDEMKSEAALTATGNAVLVGDLNIAPLETDVWSHKQLLKVVSHTPVETESLNALLAAGPWDDVVRRHIPPEEKLFSWWSYRSPNWEASDRGRRLDHVWATPDFAGRSVDVTVLKQARGWDKPSDHVPIIARFS